MPNTALEALLKHNQQVPRYTSYPTANHFNTKVDDQGYVGWLKNLPEEQAISLYIHVPFCKKMCWYCGCHTKATRKYEPVTKYLKYLKKEIALLTSKLEQKIPVSHLHFGGGSPSYIEPDDFTDLIQHIRAHFSLQTDAEIAIELDPREITELKVAAYYKAGVNRVSLGVQDFHKHVQKAINRLQPIHLVYEKMALLRSYDFQQINMDLLYGLPGQSLEDVIENMEIAAGMNPNRISLFGYAHVPWVKSHMKMINPDDLPDGRLRLEQFFAASKQLSNKGYVPIGLDHFVKVNDPMAQAYAQKTLKRNFQGYTTDNASTLIGLGPSAIGDTPSGYAQNTPDMRSYFTSIDEGRLPIAKGLPVSKHDKIIRRLIEQLMCYMEIDLKAFCAQENLPSNYFDTAVNTLATQLIEDKLVSVDGSCLQINAQAPQAVRLVCAAFDEYLHPATQKHAQVA